MLFNSHIFIFAFLPMVFIGFYGLGRLSPRLASLWLALASLFFYGWWDARYVLLLLGSIGFNYAAGQAITGPGRGRTKAICILAVTANLLLLGYFKYFNFFIENLNGWTNLDLAAPEVILPLGISFFTFTQIAFLVDAYQGKVRETDFVHYTLFVTYFPHLIAGPVLHHKEMMPQFALPGHGRIDRENVAVGLTIFILGLAKKVLIADSLAEFATPIFNAAASGGQPLLIEAWLGALAYTFQLYFDFSGYSDMAIGLSLLFNVRLPVNFASPYRATSIIEFWRRWHMTLSRFLRDYLYIPLGGNRKGEGRRYLNLMITMLLGGLWHGAGWTFVIWGGLHGFYLTVNHLWLELKRRLNWNRDSRSFDVASAVLTFLLVVLGWVFFRAENVDAAMRMIRGMLGLNGVSVSAKMAMSPLGQMLKHAGARFDGTLSLTGLDSGQAILTVMLASIIAFRLPNVQSCFRQYRPVLDESAMVNEEHEPQRGSRAPKWWHWQPKPVHAWAAGLLFALTLLHFTQVSEFLYFRF
ncbi:MBOAT family O-acyltransferase [Methylosarcina fibrata]|uniref:MBOAT family O-acyltransferase n=1 Tax=Methylosarcina fibrata TaxID=105972 RepID=UPI000373A1E3|nr:MBOAT family protein [Methylosarcina fibrata]